MSKAQARRDALARWWDRDPWPCVIATADPGKTSGWSLVKSGREGLTMIEAEAIDLYEINGVEHAIERAVRFAEKEGLPLIGVLEDWGRGGPRGLAQWIGLGESRGPWRRAMLQWEIKKIILVAQNTWRSRVVTETGARDENDEWRPFEPAEWKRAAQRAAQDHFLTRTVPGEDAGEATCMSIYAARSDQVGIALGKRWLSHNGYPECEKLEPTIKAGR